jgi:hypothetical protein
VLALVGNSGSESASQGRLGVVVFSSAKAAGTWYVFQRRELENAPSAAQPSLSVAGNVVGAYFAPKPPHRDRTQAFKTAMVHLEVNPAVNPQS